MITIDFTKYGPAITNPDKAREIYSYISSLDPSKHEITIDLSHTETMTTRCAKIVFGFLYLDLTPDVFFQNIILKDMSDILQSIIELGIEHAILQGKKDL